jgi:hypothetical protein
MIDRFIAPALTFSLLIAGHLVIVAALVNGPSPQRVEMMAKAPAATTTTAQQAS